MVMTFTDTLHAPCQLNLLVFCSAPCPSVQSKHWSLPRPLANTPSKHGWSLLTREFKALHIRRPKILSTACDHWQCNGGAVTTAQCQSPRIVHPYHDAPQAKIGRQMFRDKPSQERVPCFGMCHTSGARQSYPGSPTCLRVGPVAHIRSDANRLQPIRTGPIRWDMYVNMAHV